MCNLKSKSPIELLKLYGEIIDELKIRGIAKTRNQPISEYAKWLVVKKLGLIDVENSNEKFDGIDKEGKKYLVRSRQIIENRLVKFGVIRNLEDRNFDYLVTVTFDDLFNIKEAYLIPIDIIEENVKYNEYQNGYLVDIKLLNISSKDIKDIKSVLL